MSANPVAARRMAAMTAVVAAAITAAGCGGSTPIAPASAVCVTAVGHIRVDDYRCAGSSMAYDWWYLTPGLLAPAIGQRATVGGLTQPKGSVRRGGVPATPTTTTTKAKPPTTAKKKPTATTKRAKPAAPKPKPAAPKVRTK